LSQVMRWYMLCVLDSFPLFVVQKYLNPYLLHRYEDFYFKAEDGIRCATVTGVQTCALPILRRAKASTTTGRRSCIAPRLSPVGRAGHPVVVDALARRTRPQSSPRAPLAIEGSGAQCLQIGRASCRERLESAVGVAVRDKHE